MHRTWTAISWMKALYLHLIIWVLVNPHHFLNSTPPVCKRDFLLHICSLQTQTVNWSWYVKSQRILIYTHNGSYNILYIQTSVWEQPENLKIFLMICMSNKHHLLSSDKQTCERVRLHFPILPSEGRGAVAPWNAISSITKLWIERGGDEKALYDMWNPVRMQISVICAAPVNIYYEWRARTGQSWTWKCFCQHSRHNRIPILERGQLVLVCKELALIQ